MVPQGDTNREMLDKPNEADDVDEENDVPFGDNDEKRVEKAPAKPEGA